MRVGGDQRPGGPLGSALGMEAIEVTCELVSVDERLG